VEVKSCRVSYRDQEGVTHTVEVSAATLYEAAVLALKAFQETGWADHPTGFVEVAVKSPVVNHQVAVVQVMNWLRKAGNPKEMVMKHRLREILGWRE
jgi:hypothetical protein